MPLEAADMSLEACLMVHTCPRPSGRPAQGCSHGRGRMHRHLLRSLLTPSHNHLVGQRRSRVPEQELKGSSKGHGNWHGSREAITRDLKAAKPPYLGTPFTPHWLKDSFSGSTRHLNFLQGSIIYDVHLPSMIATSQIWWLGT